MAPSRRKEVAVTSRLVRQLSLSSTSDDNLVIVAHAVFKRYDDDGQRGLSHKRLKQFD